MDSITLHVSQFPAINLMSLEQKGGLLDCLMQYAMTGKQPGVESYDPMVVMAFTFVVDRMRTDERMAEVERTAAMNEQNRRNGTKGGRPKKPTATVENNPEKGGFENKKGVFENENLVFNEEKEIEKDKENRTEETPTPQEDKTKEKEKEKEKEAAAAAAEKSVSSSGSDAEADDGYDDRERYGKRDSEKRPRIGFLALQRYWNSKVDETGSPMTKVDCIRGNREKLVADRLQEHGGDMDAIRTVIDKAMSSGYLNGTNPRGWIGSFDWLMEQDHFTRVKEGRYDRLYAARRPQGGGCSYPSQSIPSSISVQMERLKSASHHDAAKEKTQNEKNRYLSLVKTVTENPRSFCRGALVEAYKAGILAKLGISWRP